ncbi:MAG: Gfo/Idh/MocA family oxidoreductase [Casimicrobiaceae bacterium]|nr:Gfo/Idh/MocA family oxidoreductase [Casimicrobiaceae bacterium]MCX8098120.1 Gfo/Idh/MocA family oxidoreductase [Casimicrobiaceae bacterium]MDW8311658.1 Gfo/Idh/MocA family oxidoreductase [Burkholderiales bacterium]
MSAPLNVCVIGCGAMGRNHVRVLSDLPSVELCALVDPNPHACAALSHRYRVPAYPSAEAMLEAVQPAAAVVAVPTVAHRSVAGQLIERGIHVFVEKPIASSVAEAEALIAQARAAGVGLFVGHIERFNPAVLELRQRLSAGELGRVLHVEARRQGPFPVRIQDVGVVIDLAVHDIDLVRFVTGSEVERVYAETTQRLHEAHEDLLRATMRLNDGVVASLAVDWLTPTKVRSLTVTGERGMFQVDLLTQDLFWYENAAAAEEREDDIALLRGVREGRMIRHVVRKREPLVAELEAFVRFVREPGSVEVVSGEDGTAAIHVAQAMLASARSGQVVRLV